MRKAKNARSAGLVAVVILFGVFALRAQSKTLASTMDVYVFPQKGQAASQQSQDESACYTWAVQNTGTDPFQLAKQAEAQQQQAASAQASASTAAQGSAVRVPRAGRPQARSSARSAAMLEKAPRSAPPREQLWGARAEPGPGFGPAAGRAAVGRQQASHGAAVGELQEGLLRLPRGQALPRQVLTCRLGPLRSPA